VTEYGAIALRHWKRWRPPSYAAIPDPGAYFTGLGDQAASEITELWAQMCARAGNPPAEDYLARVGRLNAMRKQAEEIVLAELFLLPPDPGAGQDGPRPPRRSPCRAVIVRVRALARPRRGASGIRRDELVHWAGTQDGPLSEDAVVTLAGLLGPVGHEPGKLPDGLRNRSGFPRVFSCLDDGKARRGRAL